MSDLLVNTPAMLSAAGALERCRAMIQPDRPAPSISACGSGEVHEAFAAAFQMIRAQDAKAYTTWANLGDSLRNTADEFARIESEMARSFG